MKLNILGDKLDDFQMTRKYRRLSTAVVCFHIAADFTNIMLTIADSKVFRTYLGDIFVSVLRGLKTAVEIAKRGTYYFIFVYNVVMHVT